MPLDAVLQECKRRSPGAVMGALKRHLYCCGHWFGLRRCLCKQPTMKQLATPYW